MRIEPPPSPPWAAGKSPPATTAARSPARPARCAAEVPRVAGDAIAIVLGHCYQTELGRIGATAQDETSSLERHDHGLGYL